MNGMFLILATFLAATIEGVEMLAILIGVGATRDRWLRPARRSAGVMASEF